MSQWIWQSPDAALVPLLVLGVIVQLFVVARSDRPGARKAILAVLNILFALFLWLFLQPPSYPDAHSTLTLITPGATPVDLRRAKRARIALAIGEHLPDDLEDRQIPTYLDLRSVRLAHPRATTLNVLGAGLADRQWQADRSWQIRFEAPAVVAGLRHVHWDRRIDAGEPMVVSGRASNPSPVSVLLRDPAGDVVNRADVAADGTFALTTNTRSPGRFVYQIELADGADIVLESQPLPVHVDEPKPIDLLILLSAPSFESRYLKNWAGRGGARLAIRTTLSSDRFLDEFVGRDAVALDQLNRSSMAQFDVIIADQRAWHALDETVQDTVYAAVEQEGLGLAVMALDAQLPLDNAERFPALVPANTRDRALAVRDAAAAASMLTLAAARFEQELGDSNVVLRDVSGQVVVASRSLGKGRVGVTLVTDSHKLVTTGHLQQHARYWRTFLHAMASPTTAPGSEIAPTLPLVDQRVQICVFGAPLSSEVTIDESLRVALRPQAHRPDEHCGYWWPARAGWHALKTNNATRQVYVYEPEHWASVRNARATSATQLAAQREPVVSVSEQPRHSIVPRWWFALLLLTVAGLLWLEQKLRDS